MLRAAAIVIQDAGATRCAARGVSRVAVVLHNMKAHEGNKPCESFSSHKRKPLAGLCLPLNSFPFNIEAMGLSNFHHQLGTAFISTTLLDSTYANKALCSLMSKVPAKLCAATLHTDATLWAGGPN